MDFVKVVAPVRDVEIEDIGVVVPKGTSVTICGEDLTRTEDLWKLLRQGALLQILSRFSRPLKSDPPPPSELVGPPPEESTSDVEKRLDAAIEAIEEMRPTTVVSSSVPNALRKLVDKAPPKHSRKGKRST